MSMSMFIKYDAHECGWVTSSSCVCLSELCNEVEVVHR